MKVVKVDPAKIFGDKTKRQPQHSSRKPISTKAKEAFATRMRENPTASERMVADELKRLGYKFKTQHLMHGYIADIYFPSKRYIVELDGKWHDPVKDARRDLHFREKGIKTLRIPSQYCFFKLGWVIHYIEKELRLRKADRTRKNRKGKYGSKKKLREPLHRENPLDDLTEQFFFATDGI